MKAEEAIRAGFAEVNRGADLVARLMAPSELPGDSRGVVVVIFTGYGYRLVEHARGLASGALAAAPLLIVGPDNLCAAKKEEQRLDAVSYASHLSAKDAEDGIERKVIADAAAETQYTPGQARVTARRIEEAGWSTVLLVTAAYHQPRAFLTLLKALIKRGLDERVRVFPAPYLLPDERWDKADEDLKKHKTWEAAFKEDELPKIIAYQQKEDVASWNELEAYIARHLS